jgi:hypothetical protein
MFHPVTLMVGPPSSYETVTRLGYSALISSAPRVILFKMLLLFFLRSRLLPDYSLRDMKQSQGRRQLGNFNREELEA